MCEWNRVVFYNHQARRLLVKVSYLLSWPGRAASTPSLPDRAHAVLRWRPGRRKEPPGSQDHGRTAGGVQHLGVPVQQLGGETLHSRWCQGSSLLWNFGFLFLFRSRLSPSARCCRLPSIVRCPQTSPDGRTNGGDLRRQTKPLQIDSARSQKQSEFAFISPPFIIKCWLNDDNAWMGRAESVFPELHPHFLNTKGRVRVRKEKKGEFLEATGTTDAFTSYLRSTMTLMVQKRTRWAQKWDSTWVSFVCVDLCLFWYTWRYIIRTVAHKLESSICARVTSDCFSKKNILNLCCNFIGTERLKCSDLILHIHGFPVFNTVQLKPLW